MPKVAEDCRISPKGKIFSLSGDTGCGYYKYYSYYTPEVRRDMRLRTYILSFFEKKKEEDIDPIGCNTL